MILNYFVQHKLLSGVAIILILAAIWFGLNSSSAPVPILQDSSGNESERQLVATLLTLRAVNLSGTIFSDPVFMSLTDFSTAIQPEPSGRPNPFAPLSGSPNLPAGANNEANIFRPPGQ